MGTTAGMAHSGHDVTPGAAGPDDKWVIDVSRWQGDIDWAAVKASGVQGAWIKVGGSDGGFYKDSRAAANITNAGNVGLMFGTYYFAVPRAATESDAKAQAAHAVECGYGSGQMWPALDLEHNQYGLTAAQLDDWAWTFCEEAWRLTNRDSVIYTGAHFGLGHTTTGHPSCPLWIANYGLNVPGTEPPGGWEPAVPMAWAETGYSAWQFNSVTTVPGIVGNVDQNTVKADFWAQMMGEGDHEEDDMAAFTSLVRTKVGSAWAQEHIGWNEVSHYLLTVESTRKVRVLTPDSLQAELFWAGKHIEEVWEVDDSFFTGGRYFLEKE